MSKKKQNNPKYFKMFVKVMDSEGFMDESQSGWLSFDKNKLPKMTLILSEAFTFEEKEKGHGSYEDWKKFLEEEHENWKIDDKPHYCNL